MKVDGRRVRSVGFGFWLLSSCSDRELDLDDETMPGASELGEEVVLRDARWRCLDESSGAPPLDGDEPIPSAIEYTVSIVDSLSMREPQGLQIDICQVADVECFAPLPSRQSRPTFGGPPSFGITLPYGFEGYLRLTAAGYVQTDYYFGGPLRGSTDGRPALFDADGNAAMLGETIPLQRIEVWDAAMRTLGVSVDPNVDPGAGALMVRTLDCLGARAAGVRVQLNEGTGVPWVMRNGVMVKSSQEAALTTDASGDAGYFAVPPGFLLVEGLVQAECESGSDCGEPPWMVAATVATRIREDTITLFALRHDYSYGR